MTLGEENRNASFKELKQSENDISQEQGVLATLKVYPDVTANFIADHMNVDVGPIHGRLNSLVEQGLVIHSGTDYKESGRGRTTYRIRKVGEGSTQKDINKNCLSISQLETVQSQLFTLRKRVNIPNSFQKAKIIEDLKATLKVYEKNMSICTRMDTL